jgi:uncharacterized Zn-binding protein involved in type VI secretion
VICAVLENHAHGTLTQLGSKFAGLHNGSIFSRVGASTKPGPIQTGSPQETLEGRRIARNGDAAMGALV